MSKEAKEKESRNDDSNMNEKLKALEATIGNLEKSYGKGTIMKLGDNPIDDIESISTGSISLDFALGIGCLPKGRVIEIYGPESSGKTTLAKTLKFKTYSFSTPVEIICAHILGEEIVKIIHKHYKGQQVNFPMKLYSNEYVENYIIENYSEKTVREISRTLGYSDKWVQKLIKKINSK